MGKTLRGIARELKDNNKKVQLIYAFNGAGKTRLSREFKELISPVSDSRGAGNSDGSGDGRGYGGGAGNPDGSGDGDNNGYAKILYYNAFTEDLFYWDNDLEGDVERKLKIQPNSYTQWVLQDQGYDQNVISHFQHYTNEKLTPRFNEKYTFTDDNGKKITVPAFSEVTFSFQRGNDDIDENIKISKGEESNFIWSIFYSLIEQVIDVLNVAESDDRETDQFNQLEYIFIDDPVSSLDENHLIELAVHIAQLIKSSEFYNGQGLKFIITTHNPLFYNVLYSELKPQGYILKRCDNGTFELEKRDGASNTSFSYHLHIKQLIEQAVVENTVQRFHFALLRNLYEKASRFLGYRNWSDLLPGDKEAYAKRIMHFYSHRSLSTEEIAEPTEPEKQTVKLLVEHLTNEYRFWQQGEQNG